MPNIIFTTLSTTIGNAENNYYIGNQWCRCVQQQEPGAKYFLSMQKIDKIVIFGTIETLLDSTKVREWNGDSGTLYHSFEMFEETLSERWQPSAKEEVQYSAYEKLMGGLRSFLCAGNESNHPLFQKQKDQIVADLQKQNQSVPDEMTMMCSCQSRGTIPVVFVPNCDQSGDNINGLMKALTKGGTKDDPVCVYMDMQGGERTAIYVNNAVLQIINESDIYHTSLTQVVATNFTPGRPKHPIMDETDRYKIVELVSGMNAFLRYGKADGIAKYLKSLQQNDTYVQQLVDAMYEIDQAISYSRLGNEEDELLSKEIDLVAAVEHLRKALNEFESEGYSSSVKKIFDILLDAIRDDFGDLLSGDSVNVIALVEWLVKKDNLFVAASVVESKLPAFFVRSGLLYYAKNCDDLQTAEDYFRLYLVKEDRPLFQFRDINHFFIKYYVSGCTYGFQWGKKDLEKKEEQHIPILPPYEKETNINYPLKYPSSYPIPMYSDYPDEIGKILVLYFYIAQYRNSGAHSVQSAFYPDDVRAAMQDIIELLKPKNTSRRNCLKDRVVDHWYQAVRLSSDQKQGNGTAIPHDLRTAVWKKCLLAETDCGELFGKGQYTIVNAKKPLFNLPNYYALGQLYFGVKYLKENWNTLQSGDTQKQTEILKDKTFAPFLKLWVNYCNSQLDKGQRIPPFETLKSLRYIVGTVKRATTQDAVVSIKKSLINYADFTLLLPYLQSEETWATYVEQKRAALQAQWDQKGIDPETEINRHYLEKLWHSIVSRKAYDKKEHREVFYPDWKALIRYYCSDEDLLEELIHTIKSC